MPFDGSSGSAGVHEMDGSAGGLGGMVMLDISAERSRTVSCPEYVVVYVQS